MANLHNAIKGRAWENIYFYYHLCHKHSPSLCFPRWDCNRIQIPFRKSHNDISFKFINTFFACKSKFGTNCQKNEWKFGILLNNGREAKKKKKRGEIWEFCRLDSAEKTTCTRKLFIWLSHGAVKIYKINLSVQLFNEGIQAKEEANNLTEERDMWTEVRVAVHTRVEPA